MKTIICFCLAFGIVSCYYDELNHASEECEKGYYIPHCFATPCMLEDTCKNFPKAICSNNYCSDSPCSTVWRDKGKIVDCGNYD